MTEQKKGTENQKWNDVERSIQEPVPEKTPEELFGVLLHSDTDGYAILQLKETEEAKDLSFLSYDDVKYLGKEPDSNLYTCVYAEPTDLRKEKDEDICEGLFYTFNCEIPEDFIGHSLSVSDVIVLKRQRELSCYYVDSFGFQELPGFLSGKNPLRGLEDQMEQNDNQLDGIINNLPEETISEKEKKFSVIEKLKAPVPEREKRPKSICSDREL